MIRLKRILTVDWDAIAGIIAAVAAIVMHFLHVIDETVLLTIMVVLIALLFIRDLRRERLIDEIHAGMVESRAALDSIQTGIVPPDAVLIGPSQLRDAIERFAAQANGEMIWHNICLSMFRPHHCSIRFCGRR